MSSGPRDVGDSRTVEAPSPSLVYGATVELRVPPTAASEAELALPPTERAPRRRLGVAVFAVAVALAAAVIGAGVAMVFGPGAPAGDEASADARATPSELVSDVPRGVPCADPPDVARIAVDGVTGSQVVERLLDQGFSCTRAVAFGSGARFGMRAPDGSSLQLDLSAGDGVLGFVDRETTSASRSGPGGHVALSWPGHGPEARALLDRVLAPE